MCAVVFSYNPNTFLLSLTNVSAQFCHRGMRAITSHSFLPTGNILWACEGASSLGDLHVEEMRVEGKYAFFVCKPTASLRGIIMGQCHCIVSNILQPIPLSNAGDTACFFPLLQCFISVEPTLVGRVRGAGWLASLETIVTASLIFLQMSYIKLLNYGHFIQT